MATVKALPFPLTQTVPAESRAEPRSRINVVLFSGGSGTHSITEALRKHPQIALKILINAYDDGHSTGRLRRLVPGMLGPSDVRKNLNRLMPANERGQKSLKMLSDHRLPVGISRADALHMIERMIDGQHRQLPDALGLAWLRLAVWQSDRFRGFLNTFREFFLRQERAGIHFDFTDCALGNLLFAGCYVQEGEDFNRAIQAFSRFYEVDPAMLLNVTQGENLFLVAEKEDGSVLLNEADIVAAQSTAKISNLFLLDSGTYLSQVERGAVPENGWGGLFRAAHLTPKINPLAQQAIAEADVIVYGPGTQHSSLFPSYMTEGLGEAIRANAGADKIFVGNIHRDHDMQEDDINDLARKFVQAMTRGGTSEAEWRGVVSHFFVQRAEDHGSARAKYIPFDASKFAYPLDTVRLSDWELQEGRHYGGYILEEMRQILQARIDVELERMQHMVSIVIPVLNEEKTIEEVLKSVIALDFQPYGLSKEVIVVDGGSTDRTLEFARSVKAVKVTQLPDRLGRGAALRHGILQARGNLIVFFPGDKEYKTEDLMQIVVSLTRDRFKAVIGSRAVKCTHLSDELKRIYENRWGLYITSKYGGMLLSILTLLLYNRYVSDILTSVKGFDAHLLRSLALKSNGRDLDSEIIAKLSQKREYLLEIPVDYAPRTRAAGKKITMMDGLRSVWALLRYRFSGN